MITINPTTQINYTFSALPNERAEKASDDKTKEAEKKIVLAVAGLAITGAAAVLIGKNSKKSYEEALKKNGVQIKDGVAVLIGSGEKYTGSIKRNVEAYGAKKETVTFVDGIMTEKVYHNFNGKELEGDFFKDGVKRLSVTKHAKDDKRYTRYVFAEDGHLKVRESHFNLSDDKFESARDAIKKI